MDSIRHHERDSAREGAGVYAVSPTGEGCRRFLMSAIDDTAYVIPD